MANIINLTGYTVTVPSGWRTAEGFGKFHLLGRLIVNTHDREFNTTISPNLYIGYMLSNQASKYITYYSTTQSTSGYSFYLSDLPFVLIITGGTDATNPNLIQWLYDNNATCEKTGGEEEPSLPDTEINKTNNLPAFLKDLYQGIASKKPNASRNPQDFRAEIEAIETGGGSGLDINGIIREYKVNAGATVNAGDFVEFVNKCGNGEFHSGTTDFLSACKLDNNRVFVAYQDGGNSSRGTAVVLTIDGTAINVGTEKVFDSKQTTYISACVLTDSKVLVAYYASGYGTAVALTIDGTAINVGSEFTFCSHAIAAVSTCALTDSKVLVTYSDTYVSSNGIVGVVLTIDGSTISMGSSTRVLSNIGTYNSVVRLTDNMALVAFNNYYATGYARVLAIDGTTISVGTSEIFNSGVTNYISACALTDSKVLVVYQKTLTDSEENTIYSGAAKVLTRSDLTISIGNEIVFKEGTTSYISVGALSERKALVSYDGSAQVLTIDGTTITAGQTVIFNAGTTEGSSVGTTKSVIPFSANSALVVYASGTGKYASLSIDDTTITVNEASGTFVEKATSNLHNVGVAKTSGVAGETVEVYCAV